MARSTVSRTLRKNRLSSSPGTWKCASSASAKGLWLPPPSSAIWSALVAITTMVLRGTLSTRARPGGVLPRPAMVMERDSRSMKGLLRQESSSTMPSFLACDASPMNRSSGSAS